MNITGEISTLRDEKYNLESIVWHHQFLLEQGLITMAETRAKELAEVYNQIDQIRKTLRVLLMRLIVSTQAVLSKKRENNCARGFEMEIGYKNRKEVRIVKLSILVVFMVQIFLSILWMIYNINNIPIFGDTSEYISIARNQLVLDEYRTIGYILILKMMFTLEKITDVPFQIWTYILQTLVCYSVLYYTFNTVIFKILKEKFSYIAHSWKYSVLSATYVLCIPMITFFNFTVLTDSFAFSFTLLTVALTIKLLLMETNIIRTGICLILSVFLLSIVRADRLYICIMFLLLCFIAKIIIVEKRKRITWLSFLLIITLTATISVKVINSMTQTTTNARVPMSVGLVLLNRVVWPEFENNYNDFDEKVKNVLSFEDAGIADEHNNKITYYLAPHIEESVGRQTAQSIYLSMVKTVVINNPFKIMSDILFDFLSYLFLPFFSMASALGLVQSADPWNIYCVSQATPTLTQIVSNFYCFSGGFIGTLSTGWVVLKLKNKKRFFFLLPVWVMAVLISVGFAVISSADPNARYAIYNYAAWSMTFISLGPIYLAQKIGRKNQGERYD